MATRKSSTFACRVVVAPARRRDMRQGDKEDRLHETAYRMGYDDATAGLPEDPDPTTVAGLSPAVKDLFLVWDAYVEGWVDAGGELPF
jgi:hypothetical protein